MAENHLSCKSNQSRSHQSAFTIEILSSSPMSPDTETAES